MNKLEIWFTQLLRCIEQQKDFCPHRNVHVTFIHLVSNEPVEGFCKDCKKK